MDKLKKELINFTGMFTKDQIEVMSKITALNTIMKLDGPKNNSALIREVIEATVEYLHFAVEEDDPNRAPSQTYIKRLRLFDLPNNGNTKTKTVTIEKNMMEQIDNIAAYNKFHGLQPKYAVRLVRNAFNFYVKEKYPQFML